MFYFLLKNSKKCFFKIVGLGSLLIASLAAVKLSVETEASSAASSVVATSTTSVSFDTTLEVRTIVVFLMRMFVEKSSKVERIDLVELRRSNDNFFEPSFIFIRLRMLSFLLQSLFSFLLLHVMLTKLFKDLNHMLHLKNGIHVYDLQNCL